MLKHYRIVLNSLFIVLSLISTAQTNPASPRRDWYVGHYEGILKDSFPNISIPCSFNVYWTQNHPLAPYPNDDSTVTIPLDAYSRLVVCIDSTVQTGGNSNCSNWPNPAAYGVLYSDSSFYYMFTASFGCYCVTGGNFCHNGNLLVFRGKKTSDTPVGLAEDLLKNSQAVIYPNPVELGHVNVLSNIEFDELVFNDLLGKQYNITISKTGSGYHLDLPEGIEAGVYVLVMRKGKQVLTKKVLVK